MKDGIKQLYCIAQLPVSTQARGIFKYTFLADSLAYILKINLFVNKTLTIKHITRN